jgi:predicted membrane channel-forming protein YqfA (hemolysin III family)
MIRIAQAWFLVLIVGSLQPVRPAAMVGPAGISLHRAIHWLAFAGAALLLLALSSCRRQEIRNAVVLVLLGVSLEYLQHVLYRNSMEWWDIRDDTLAILAAFVLYHFARARKPAAAPPG